MTATITETMREPAANHSHMNEAPPSYPTKRPGELLYDNNIEMTSVSPTSKELEANYSRSDLQVQDAPEDEEPESHSCARKFQLCTLNFCKTYSSIIVRLIVLGLLVLFAIYFGFALNHKIDGPAHALIACTCIIIALIIYVFIRDRFGGHIWKHCFGPVVHFLSRQWPWARWIIIPAVIIGFCMLLIFGIVREFQQFQSIIGLVFFVCLLWLTSKHPDQISWRPVIWGFGLQFIVGLLVLRWKWGYQAVNFLSNEITKFLAYTNEASAGVFGDPFFIFHPFVFLAMPMLIFFGAVMSILYFVGLTQTIAAKIGWLMSISMGTTAIESLSVAANIFLSGLDCMLMLKPYLGKLTKSEFCCFLVGNHSTVAGFAFAVFVLFGAPPEHLLSAAVMSAPAAIACSKLNYPETEKSSFKEIKNLKIETAQEGNVIEAGANGAAAAGKTVVAVVVNLIAFVSVLTFINATLRWFGARIGQDNPPWSFQLFCSYIFIPLALMMGVAWKDARAVASLLGLKIFTSEILAYQEMGDMIDKGMLSERSVAIATYALCGFSSIATLAMAVGIWNAVEPTKTRQMASMMVRVITCANISCFMTACIAGLLHSQDVIKDRDAKDDRENKILMSVLGLIPGYKELLPDE